MTSSTIIAPAPVAQRVEWLNRQISLVRGFIERDSNYLRDYPDSVPDQISLRSWQQHYDELTADLQALQSHSAGGQ